jgi:hypothetical protein
MNMCYGFKYKNKEITIVIDGIVKVFSWEKTTKIMNTLKK